MSKLKHCGWAVVLASGVCGAADWPQWMGPNRDGLTEETGLLQSWPDGGPPVAWRIDTAGLGYSGPAIADGKIYLLGSRNETEQLIALDEATGRELWATDLAEEYENGWGNGPRNTPTVDGDRVYALAAGGALVCVDVSNGQEIWNVELLDFGGEIPNWGFAESPLIDGDRLVVAAGGEGGSVVALSKATGELLWRSEGMNDDPHYSSTIVAFPNGQKQYVRLMVEHLVGIEPETGDVLWSVEFPGRVAVIPTPLVRDNQIYVTAGYGVGCMMVEIAPDNTATVAYDNKTMKNHHGGVVLLGDKLYGHSDGVGWLCQEFATGDSVWRERGALGKGAIGYADGRFYCLDEESGDVVLIEASAAGWSERGRFTLEPQTELRKPRGKIWVHPVIANGKLYLRDQELFFCFDVAAN